MQPSQRILIPESVYDNLVAAVRKHLPLLHRYLELRSKILGISDLKMYDVYTPLHLLNIVLPTKKP